MNTEFRFTLQKYRPGSKTTCPSCGKRSCFVRYVDTTGVYTFPDDVGRCDHESSCGYHKTPRQFFDENPDVAEHLFKDKWTDNSWNHHLPSSSLVHHQPAVPKEPSYIEESIVRRTLSHYDINPLFLFLKSVFGDQEALRLMEHYRVGTSKLWSGSTVFWQTDTEGNVRGGKIMAYDPKTGHRIKTDGAKVCWAHVALRLADFNLRQCLFGEHLLAQSAEQLVMIVESEKTAIICHHFMPEYVWLATGGKHGCFNREAMKVLRGRDVTLFPDLEAYEEWNNKIPMLRSIAHTVSINDYLEKNATDEQRSHGLDIADFLLMTDTPQMILQRMIERNPAIQLLIDKLDLVLVEE